MLRKILIGLAVVFVLIQFIRPARNLSGDDTNHIATKFSFPGNVAPLIEKACYDCHSNKTNYPWYANIQPAGWWLANHVNEGKEHLNFSEFASYSPKDQRHAFKEIFETVQEGEMPLPSYTYLGLHPEAKLSALDRQAITAWAQEQAAIAGQLPGSQSGSPAEEEDDD